MMIIHAKHIMHYTTIKYVRFDHAKAYIVIEVHINGISVALVSMQSQIYAGKKINEQANQLNYIDSPCDAGTFDLTLAILGHN